MFSILSPALEKASSMSCIQPFPLLRFSKNILTKVSQDLESFPFSSRTFQAEIPTLSTVCPPDQERESSARSFRT